MAVYTEVSDEELAAFAAQYDIGAVQSFKGIAEGVENSNFLLETERGQYILTLYEKRTRPEDLPFFLSLMEHLAARGLACPTPIHGRDGQALRQLCARPAAMVSFLKGMSARSLQPWHCQALGQALGALHKAGGDFKGVRANALSVAGWRPLFEQARQGADQVSPGLEKQIAQELDQLEKEWPLDLPKGVIHADLFPDNVFFLGDKLSGLIDFYFACTDFLTYDIAICLNAWCFEKDLSFNATKARLLLGAYEKVRPLEEAEVAALPLLCRGAAMRFLLTRLYDWLNTPPGAFVTRKDPREYLKKLRFHQGIRSAAAYGLDAR
ncbi:MAG: homoserine kinase [Alphaproteobacteria bacterium]|nr:homoserine kinase [Alphaproteobacteria bacterium]